MYNVVPCLLMNEDKQVPADRFANEDTLRVDSCSTIESVSQANWVIVMILLISYMFVYR